jgi:hypothetical protein
MRQQDGQRAHHTVHSEKGGVARPLLLCCQLASMCFGLGSVLSLQPGHSSPCVTKLQENVWPWQMVSDLYDSGVLPNGTAQAARFMLDSYIQPHIGGQ